MRLAALALVLLCGCSRTVAPPFSALFEKARGEFRAGDLTKAQLSAEQGLAAAGTRGDAFFQWKFRLLRAEILLNTKRTDLAVAELGEAMPAGSEFAPLAARKLMLQGQAAIVDHPDRSAALLADARRAAEAAQATDVLLDIENLQGVRALRGKRLDEAEVFLRSALNRARALEAPDTEAGIVLNLGMIRFQRYRYDEALGYFEEASRQAARFPIIYSAAQLNLAMCYSNLGEYDRAIQIHRKSADTYEHSGAKHYLQLSLGETGHTYLLKGDNQAAVPYLQRAIGIARELGRTVDASIWAGNLSAVYSELGDWQNAAAQNDEAVRLKTTAHVNTLFYNLLNSARIAQGRGDTAQAVKLYTRAIAEGKDDPSVNWEAHEGIGAIAVRAGQPAEAVRHFETAVNVVEKTRGDLLRTEFKLPFLSHLIRLYEEYVDILLEQGQTDRALAVADSSRAQVLAEHYGSIASRRLAPDAFHALARQTNSVLLSYWLGRERSHAWAVTGRELHHIELPPAAEIEGLVRDYQEAIERRLADPLRTHIPAGDRLYQVLIEPLRAWIPSGSRVILTPDGALHGLNFESIPLPGETPRYLIQEVTLTLAPSLALLAGKARDANTAHRLLLLGDPTSNDPAFPRLPQAAQEIAAVTQRFGGTGNVVLSGEGATPAAWRAAGPGAFSAIHFAAHAVANRESPLDSAVLLTGGKLYARDVMEIPLAADLVTVSACRGAGARTYSGEGLVGFSWAFLRAGARNVIAGLWDVNDQSTAVLMDALYGELAGGKPPADALRAAKLALIANAGNLHKPYYWAPFQLYTVAP
jgi:CHAT domain-containing protein